ncbi:MAG TPA: AraC family transcriptional regulator [Armatimonadota bacterium]|jgi:AraC-like DNA-binding protein
MESLCEEYGALSLAWVLHHRWQPGQYLRQHVAQAYGLWLPRQGVVRVESALGTWQVTPGQAFWLPPSLTRDISTPEGAEWLSVGLRLNGSDALRLSTAALTPCCWTPDAATRAMMETWMRHLLALATGEGPGTRDMRLGLGRALLGAAMTHCAALPDQLPRWLSATLQQMQRDPSLPMATLAQQAGYSAAQFRHLFHHYLGIPPRTFQQQCRLEQACQLLAATELPVCAIAERLAFASHTQFTRFFVQACGITPSRYRAHKAMPQV